MQWNSSQVIYFKKSWFSSLSVFVLAPNLIEVETPPEYVLEKIKKIFWLYFRLNLS